MRMTFLMIINQKNYYEGITTILSVLGQKSWNDEYQVVLVYNDLDKAMRKSAEEFLGGKANVVLMKDTGVNDEQDILKLDLKKIQEISERFFVLQSKTFVRKNINYLYEKYKDKIVAGKNVARCFSTGEAEIEKHDWGFASVDTRVLPADVNCLMDVEKQNLVQDFDLEDYFHVHPMISLAEVNGCFKASYSDLDLLESEAAVVRLYTSIETRLRECTMVAKEWSYYFKSVPQVSKEIERKLDKQIIKSGFVFVRANSFEAEAGILGIPLIKKKYSQSGYVIKVLGIPVITQKNSEFFQKTYLLGVRICKEINFAYIDQMLVERSLEIGKEIEAASQRLADNFVANNEREVSNVKVDTKKLSEEANSLLLYDLFKALKSNKVDKQEEIEFDLLQAKGGVGNE